MNEPVKHEVKRPSPLLIGAARIIFAGIRLGIQRVKASRGYDRHGSRYPNPILFIAGLPKSGTTWLENMLASYPGFQPITPVGAVQYEVKRKESHSYPLPKDFFRSLKSELLIIKMHLNGSVHNAEVLVSDKIKYVILFRDLRDVALSYGFYVSRTPWHPDFIQYKNLSPGERLKVFADTHLEEYKNWIQLWRDNRDPELSIIITYEEMRRNPVKALARAAALFGLDSSPDLISSIVDQHALDKIPPEADQGPQSIGSVVRKGQVGDWANYFTPELKTIYKERIGQLLIDLGYETDLNW